MLVCDFSAQFSIKYSSYGMQFQSHAQTQNFNCGKNDWTDMSANTSSLLIKIINIWRKRVPIESSDVFGWRPNTQLYKHSVL